VPDYSDEHVREYWQQRAARFFAQPTDALQTALRKVVADDTWARDVAAASLELDRGIVELFSKLKVNVDVPIDFNRDPVHAVQWPVGKHWSKYRTFDPALADIKCVWELSRFSIAYKLARDYVRNSNTRAAEQFSEMVLRWRSTNPNGLTAQWMCGQEATFRLMALLFGACVMLPHIANDEVLRAVSELAWYTGRQIDRKISFARSQKNNHAVSEAVGLWTIGVMFPELKSANHWRRRGHAILKAEMSRQVYSDGSYVQHSMSYHRVMLDDVLWATALARSAGERLDPTILQQAQRATDWLLQMIESQNGRTPNYGSNDGANVLPLSCSDYLDYRPVAQTANYAFHGRLCFEHGPWDEKLLWLFGASSLKSVMKSVDRPVIWSAPIGGYFILRGDHTCAFTRIHSYVDRPSQADLLHFDLWYESHNVLRDGGTYQYNAPGGWADYFKSTSAHNTVQVDHCDQMEKGPRFLWLHWAKSQVTVFERSRDGRVAYLEGEHYGYRRLPDPVTHRRAVLKVDDAYLIIDDLLGSAPHHLALRWRLMPHEWVRVDDAWVSQLDDRSLEINVFVPSGLTSQLVSGQSEPTIEGWESLYYCVKAPSPTLISAGTVPLPVRLITLFKPAGADLRLDVGQTSLSDIRRPTTIGALTHDLAEVVEKVSQGRVVATAPAQTT
jgi:hypothetical protein